MDIREAVAKRISNRAYLDQLVEPEKIAALEARIREINEAEGLHFQLIGPASDSGYAAIMDRKLFATDVKHCIACVGPTDVLSREKIGYFGEELVLMATQMGLGSCWVASTYQRDSVAFELAEGEDVACIITLGYVPEKQPLKQATLRMGLRARNKNVHQLMAGDVDVAPTWFVDGVKCAIAGPTAVNMQPVVFTWEDDVASADIPDQVRPIQDVDLGICKYHFMVGSGQPGTWEWGRGGRFVLA